MASKEEECVVVTPLSTVSWNAMWNFMAGTLPWRMFVDRDVDSFIARVFTPLPTELTIEPSIEEPSEEKDPSFLSVFFLASQSVTIANYDEVRVVASLLFGQMLTLITAPPRYQKCLKANFIFSRTENYLKLVKLWTRANHKRGLYGGGAIALQRFYAKQDAQVAHFIWVVLFNNMLYSLTTRGKCLSVAENQWLLSTCGGSRNTRLWENISW